MSLGVVQLTELGGSLPLVRVSAEHGSRSLTLCTNDTTHVYELLELLQGEMEKGTYQHHNTI